MPEAGRASVKFVGDYSALMAGLTSTLAPGKMSGIGKKAGLAVGGAFAAAGAFSVVKDAVKVTKEFDKEISSLGAVAGATEKQMDKLRKQAIKLGADTAFSATEAAQAQTELAKGGLNAAQILGGSLKSALDLAAAGEMGLAQAAETTVNAMQLFEMQGKQTGAIADMLATAANRTTADVEDFAMSLKMGGSVAKQAGYDLNETVVILEALAEAGIKNSDAGTSMKASMIQLLNPTTKQAKLADQLGISWLKQNGELKNGIQISKELSRATADMTKAERTKTFAVLAGTDGFRTLAALYDAGVGKLRNYSRANRETGTAAEVAARKLDNLAGDTEELSGAWETFQITVGTMVTPALRDLTQVATEAVNAVTAIFNDKSLSGGEKFQRLIELAVKGIARGFEELTKAAVKAAPEVAVAFAKGFASAPIWMQLAGAGLMLRMFGGAAGVTAAGTKIGGLFMASFASVAQTYSLARSFGRGKGAAGFAGMGSLALPMATSLFASLKRIIPGLAATFAIGSVISSAIAGDMKAALVKAGGALIGGGLGFLVGGPVGAAIGAGIGAGLSDVISGLFGGDVEKTLREQIQEGTKRLRKGIQSEIASIANLRAATSGQVKARRRQKRATDEVTRAQRALNRARAQHGPNSAKAEAAEARYRIALDKSRRAEQRLRRANRLQGAERRATIRIMRDNVAQAQINIGTLQRERGELRKQRRENLRNNGSIDELREIQKKLRTNSKQLNQEQQRVNKTIQRAGQVIGPRFARSLEVIDLSVANLKKVAPEMGRAVSDSMRQSNQATNRATFKFKALDNQVIDTRQVFGRNMSRSADVTRDSMGTIKEALQAQLENIQNIGTPQARRRGGLIERLRQKFQNGGVPVALSSGELWKTPDGKAGIVPGRPTAADNVLTSMPVGTKIFTFDGQRRLAEGASESQALRDQMPHFAGGGIVKPEIVGGTPKSQKVANAAVEVVHSKATKRLQRAKNLAARSRSGGNWSGGSGQYPGVSGDTDFMPALGQALSAMSRAVGQSIHVRSGWRSYAEQAALYAAYLNGTGNLAAPPGSSNHESGRAADITPGSEVFGSAAGRFGLGFTVPGESWHIELLRRGGIVGLLRLATGGLVKNPWFNKSTKKGNINGIWPSADLTKNPSGWHALPTLPPYVFGALAEAAGRHFNIDVPGRAMMQMVMHEGGTPEGGKPGSRGTDPGGTVGYGPWAITTSYNDALVKRFGGSYGAMNNPVLNAAAMAHIVKSQGLGAWYGDQYVTDPSAHWRGRYQLKNALGGIGYSAALKSALRGKFEGDADAGPSPADMAKSRKGQRNKQVRDLIQKAFGQKAAKGKKGALWQILDLYARYGDFGSRPGGTVAGGVAPGERIYEAAEFLSKARGIAGILDPNRGAGQLYNLVKWLQKNVPMTGAKEANEKLSDRLANVRKSSAARAATKRKNVLTAIAARGMDYPHKKRLIRSDRIIRTVDEWIELAMRDHTAEWGDGGSEYTDAEVDYEKRLNLSLLDSLRDRKKLIAGSLKHVSAERARLAEQLAIAPKWKRPGIRKALTNSRGTLSNLRTNWEELVGLTGRGGRIGEVKATLADLGVRSTVEQQAAAGISFQDLQQIIEFAKAGGYNNLPMFHAGGVFRAPAGRTEGPALLRDGETIRTPEQERALAGDVKVELHFADGTGWLREFVDVRVVENDRRRDQRMKAGVR